MSKVKITETILRDAQQTIMASRMTTQDMMPMFEKLDKVGYASIDAWGGAIFDSCLRFLNEDPWNRLKSIKKGIKNTPLMMLVRGQNLLGYRHYSDETVELFIRKSIESGINIVRAYDPLNDIRNLSSVFMAAKKEAAHIQGTFCYTESPCNDLEGFVRLARELCEMGADSICIKDMSGILTPNGAQQLIIAIKEYVKVPLQLHSHCTAGLASMSYIKAIEAGVDVVDCAISPMAMGQSQPATESIVNELKCTPFDTGLNTELLSEIAEYFEKVRDTAFEAGLADMKDKRFDINALEYQLPGGMVSNIMAELERVGKLDRYNDVLAEVTKVREDFGFPPLVIPVSQIIGTQALMNIIAGDRYKIVSKEAKALVKGELGKTPKEISKEIIQLVLGDEEPILQRPADLIENELANAKSLINGYFEHEEDLLTYLTLPEPAIKYFKYRQAGKYKIDDAMVNFEDNVYPV